ncbi:hypothetical protein [Nannocystis punicea]|uniref:Uncharacterized protein n=1 Tax=Nannocystis punicea TaxID=2995304 RepID=A0ABY7HBL9_9BACT|nr:hypothetical protein [Nannocystis poenicansa]WAS96668.1 hypothetical protein O0S08_11000 [Nannocystis poenicansa]
MSTIIIQSIPIQLPPDRVAHITTRDGIRIRVEPAPASASDPPPRLRRSRKEVAEEMDQLLRLVRSSGRMGASMDLIRRALGIEPYSRGYFRLCQRLHRMVKAGKLVSTGPCAHRTYHPALDPAIHSR